MEALEEAHTEVHIAVPYSKHMSLELACCMDLAVAAEFHMDFAFHTIENRSWYKAVGYSLMTKIWLDCLALFPKEHNRLGLASHNLDSKQLPLGVALRTHYTSLLSSLSVHTNVHNYKSRLRLLHSTRA